MNREAGSPDPLGLDAGGNNHRAEPAGGDIGNAAVGAPCSPSSPPRHPAHQERLRAGAAALRRLPQGPQLLSVGMATPTSASLSEPPVAELSAFSMPFGNLERLNAESLTSPRGEQLY